ncbi:SDR family oxidoreductase [Desulfatirhabdium butyrativorans]|uniref:SDR family oxidoreductase n=1 Tax=Desulfatirhabdium butyrativorans TaxID=340467 RepID=UPI00048641CF|nr:SDR family oxidoreductase [Desulfatirhabdium butyrativorans]
MNGPMNVLLTGATGFLGEYLLAELLERGHTVWALYRNASRRIDTIRFLGSLGLPYTADSLHWFKCEVLELDKRWDRLCQQHPGIHEVNTLLHSAASIRLHMDKSGEPLRTNLGGAKVLARLAERIPIQVHMISTAYVCGLVQGAIIREINHPPGDFVNVYEESKWEAEQLWHLKATLLRPSIIVGHSETARCKTFTGWYILFQAMHLLDRLMDENKDFNRLNLDIHLPSAPHATINIVPVDYVARAAVAIIENPDNHNKIFHLTHPDPPSHQWTMDYVCKRFNVGGIHFSGDGTSMTEPRNPIERMVYRQIKTILFHFSNNPVFDRTNTNHATPHMPVPPITQDRVDRLLDYAIARDWGQGPG